MLVYFAYYFLSFLVSSSFSLRSLVASDHLQAAIAKVPFVDVLGAMMDETLPLTVHEFDEWGDPKNNGTIIPRGIILVDDDVVILFACL
jgi:hypothetical protein